MILGYIGLMLMQTGEVDHAFIYHAMENLSRVNVAGSFNGWNKDADPLRVSADGVTWTKHIKLKPGSYTYKFVLNGDTWITDPKAARNVDDGNGNTNSQLIIGGAGDSKPALIGDGIITASALLHLSEIPYLNYDRGKLTLALRTRTTDIKSVQVAVDGVGTFKMSDVGGDGFYDMYSVQVPWDRKKDVNYRFLLDDGKGPYIFGPQGLKSLMGIPGGHQPWKASKQKPNHNLPADTFVVNAKTFKPFVVPDWVEHSVIYHIFPDRFANGDKRNDPANVVAWDGKPTYSNYFGGDIAGVEQHLDYLKGLGISTVFFNPVFKSPSNHRYETADYLKIDPIFGTNEEFFKLTHDLKGLRHCELA